MEQVTTQAQPKQRRADKGKGKAKTSATPRRADPLAMPASPIFRAATSFAPPTDPLGSFGRGTQGKRSEVPHRAAMESSFGHDFGDVNAFLGQSGPAADLNARAATRGKDIVFAESNPSRELVAHELAHVVQGEQGTTASTDVASPHSAAEKEADAVASKAAQGDPVSVQGSQDAGLHLFPAAADNSIALDNIIDPGAFKKASYVRFARRGTNITQIDSWLKAIVDAKDIDSLKYAVHQAREACWAWRDKHANDTTGSVVKRKSAILDLRKALRKAEGAIDAKLGAPGPTAPTESHDSPGTLPTQDRTKGAHALNAASARQLARGGGGKKGEDLEDGSGVDIADELTSNYTDSVGVIGAGKDIRETDNNNEYVKMAGGSVDVMEGSGMALSGGVGVVSGISKLSDPNASTYDKVVGGTQVATGTATTAGGISKIVGGAQELNQKDSGKVAGGVSDGIMGGVSVANGLLEIADFGKGIADMRKEGWKNMGDFEKVDFLVARGQNLLGVASATANAVNGFTKAATGAASAGASTAGAALGVATGSVEVLHGGYKLIDAGMKRKKLTEASKKSDEAISGLTSQISDTDAEIGKLDAKLGKLPSSSRVRKARYTAAKQTLEDLKVELQTKLDELKAQKAKFGPVVEAMRKVQKNRQKEAGMKMALGAGSVVSGALILSGVGAPIAIGIGVLIGLVKLGSAIVSFARGKKASKMTRIATRLTDDGSPKGKADDPGDVGYRAMEKRIYASYYNNYENAMSKSTPPAGMKSSSWGHIRDFVHEEKMKRVPLKQTRRHAKGASNKMWGKSAAQDNWGEICDNGTVVAKEKPGRGRRLELFFTASAHKSSQAKMASNAELAQGIVDIAMGSFDASKRQFVSSQVTPVGKPPSGEDVGVQTSKALLANAGVDTATWCNLWKKCGGHFKGDAAKERGAGKTYKTDVAPDRVALTTEIAKKINKL